MEDLAACIVGGPFADEPGERVVVELECVLDGVALGVVQVLPQGDSVSGAEVVPGGDDLAGQVQAVLDEIDHLAEAGNGLYVPGGVRFVLAVCHGNSWG